MTKLIKVNKIWKGTQASIKDYQLKKAEGKKIIIDHWELNGNDSY